MASTIKGITIDIGGNTQPLEKALKEVDQTARGLTSELRVIDKLLKLDPTNTTLLAQKQKVLAESISNTESKLRKLKEAQAQAKEQLERGDIGEDQYRALERQVYQTEKSLTDLKNEAQALDTALEQAGDESREAAGKVGEFGAQADRAADDVDDFGGRAKTSMAAIATATLAAVAAVGKIGDEISDASKAAALYADDINTMAAQYGITTDSLQRFAYASDLVDVSVETFGASLGRLTRNMGNAQKGAADQVQAFNALGVSITDSDGKMRDSEDVFYDLIDALGRFEDETQADIYASRLFGRSFQDLKPLVVAGTDSLKSLGDEAESVGAVMGTDTLGSLNAYNDSLDRLSNLSDVATRAFSSGMAPALERVTNTLNEKLASPEVQRKLEKIGEAIGNVIAAFADFALFVIENAEPIVSVIGAIGAGVAAWKIAEKAQAGTAALKTLGKTLTSTGGIIGMVVAGLGTLAAVVESVAGPSEEFKKLADEAKNLADSTEEAVESGKNELAVLKAQQKELPSLIDRLYQLNDAEKRTSSEQTELANLVTRLNQQYSGLGLAVDKSTGKLNLNRAELEKSADAIREMAEAQARQEAYYEAVQKQIDAEGNLALSIQKTRDAMLQGKEATEETKAQLEEYIMTLATSDERFAEVMDSANVWSADVVEGLKAVRDNASALDTATEANAYFAEGLDMTAVAAGEAAAATDELTASTAALTEQDAVALMRRLAFGEQLNEADTANLEAWKETNADRAKVLEETVEREAELQQARVDAATNANDKIQKSDQISLAKATENLKANTKLVKEYTSDMDYLYGKIPDIVYQHLEEAGVDQARLVSEMADSMREGGGKIANDYVAAYIDGLYQGKEPLAVAGYDLGSATMDSTGLGIAENAAATSEAGQQLQSMYTEMQNLIMADDMFTYLGRGIINQLTNGMRDMRSKLLDVASNIASQLKSKFNFSVSVAGTSTGARIRSYDIGGYFTSPQIIQIAEKRPEFVGAADDLESFINKAVNNAFVGVNPILLQNVKLPRTAAQSSSVQVNVSMPISVSRSLTDSEIQQKARTITGVVQRELAKVTGGKVG